MLDFFLKKFAVTSRLAIDEEKDFYKSLKIELFELLRLYGGCTFNNGLYRIHSFKNSTKWSLLIGNYFSGYRNKIFPFGFDWLGRQFCLNHSGDIIFMFDPATMEDFKLKKDLFMFHEEELANDMLSMDLFKKVLVFYKINSVDYSECLGYKIPLFLGGKDIIENYEKQDIEVYWHIVSQLHQKIKDLPEGTKIGNIKLE